MAISAIWKVMKRPWRTIFAPTLITLAARARKVIGDQWPTPSGKASVLRKLPRL